MLSSRLGSYRLQRNAGLASVCPARATNRRQFLVRPVAAGRSAREDDDDDGEVAVPGKPIRVERLLANLGYGKRRECAALIKQGRATLRNGGKLKVGEKVLPGSVVLDGEELDPPSPLVLVLNKPTGYVVTSPDDENVSDPTVYDLLPYRFAKRRPFLSCVGRLDKETSGLLLLTDDGAMLHRINSPKRGIWKVYEATLEKPLPPKAAAAAVKKFASGTMMLENDFTPLLPARLEVTGERTARVAICEGRYHQVRRMFAAVGSHVVALRRVSVGALALAALGEGGEGPLPEAVWRFLTPEELQRVFEGPSSDEILGTSTGTGNGTGTGTAGASSSALPQPQQPAAALGSGAGTAAAGSAAAVERDRGATASTSGGSGGSGSGGEEAGEEEERLTKKEKKKGKKGSKEAERAEALAQVLARARRVSKGRGGEEEDGGEGEDEGEVEDVELLDLDLDLGKAKGRARLRVSHDEEVEASEPEDVAETAGGRRRARRPVKRPPSIRQGAVLGGAGEEGEGVEEVDIVPGAGGAVRRYTDGEKWRRRRDQIRELLPT
ncbi:hypothetical protein HYH03_008409 [Edaphochlamys debaryana]|uniref:Pseudouridine synthase RsuA/RluA-like domain-containing protein n=1 Tax=Edaphochlamys debaryana TaxID=47281 RepID=A0A836BYT2_9CHLO|nr:hypothetical protein HYH03_008409 [Edaphochlamys debaryana]|eukprot:KAG2493272.1 hypothetical protein HYH03_008409 [Edaphochlamys debaryana]